MIYIIHIVCLVCKESEYRTWKRWQNRALSLWSNRYSWLVLIMFNETHTLRSTLTCNNKLFFMVAACVCVCVWDNTPVWVWIRYGFDSQFHSCSVVCVLHVVTLLLYIVLSMTILCDSLFSYFSFGFVLFCFLFRETSVTSVKHVCTKRVSDQLWFKTENLYTK